MPDIDGGRKLTPKQTKLVKPKSARGKRYLEARAPKLVEDVKRCLFLYGGHTSQVIKDVITDLYRLKKLEGIKYTRKNEVRPFEPGGEASLEFYAQRSDCALVALGSHSKKRPHNLVLARLFDGHLLDQLELGVTASSSIASFGAAASETQLGNKPAMLFVGDGFERMPALQLAKSLLLDLFRGEQVDSINLAGLDRVMLAVALTEDKILLRQYSMKYKKSGGRVPRCALREMGPRLDLEVRRMRQATGDALKEALRQPKLGKKKEKNVGFEQLSGKVGRIYMPKQKLDTISLAKPKGVKRERREAAAAAAAAGKAAKAGKQSEAAAPEPSSGRPPRSKRQRTAGGEES